MKVRSIVSPVYGLAASGVVHCRAVAKVPISGRSRGLFVVVTVRGAESSFTLSPVQRLGITALTRGDRRL